MVKKNKNDKSLFEIKLKNFFKNNEILLLFAMGIFLVGIFSLLSTNNSKTIIDTNKLYGDDVIEMYYFHLTTCPHCIEQNKFMDEVLFKKYPNLRIHRFEMTDSKSYPKYQEMAKNYVELDANKFPGTPLTIIGDIVNIGFGTAKTTGPKIIAMVEAEQKKIDSNWDSSKKRTVDLNKK